MPFLCGYFSSEHIKAEGEEWSPLPLCAAGLVPSLMGILFKFVLYGFCFFCLEINSKDPILMPHVDLEIENSDAL